MRLLVFFILHCFNTYACKACIGLLAKYGFNFRFASHQQVIFLCRKPALCFQKSYSTFFNYRINKQKQIILNAAVFKECCTI